MATTFDAIGADPEALQDDDLRRPAGAADRDRHPARPAAVPRRVRRARSAACSPACRTCGSRCRASTTRSRSARRCSPAASPPTSACAASSASSSLLVEQPTTKSSLKRLEDRSTAPSRSPSTSCPAQTVCNYWNYFWTLLPEHLTEEDSIGFSQRVSLIATPPGPTSTCTSSTSTSTAPGRCRLPDVSADHRPGRGRDRPLDRRLLGRCRPTARPASPADPGEFEPARAADPARQPGRRRPARTAPTASPARPATCRASCSSPGQPKSNPAVVVPDIPGDRGVTDVYWNQDGTRELRDTRVAARQP